MSFVDEIIDIISSSHPNGVSETGLRSKLVYLNRRNMYKSDAVEDHTFAAYLHAIWFLREKKILQCDSQDRIYKIDPIALLRFELSKQKE